MSLHWSWPSKLSALKQLAQSGSFISHWLSKRSIWVLRFTSFLHKHGTPKSKAWWSVTVTHIHPSTPYIFFFFSHSHKELRDLYTFRQPHTAKGVKSPAAMGSTVSWETFFNLFSLYEQPFFQTLHLTWKEGGSPCDTEAADDFGFSDSAGSSCRHQTLPVCEPRAMGQFGSGTAAAQVQLHPWLKQTTTLRQCLSACQTPRQMPLRLCNFHSYKRDSTQE